MFPRRILLSGGGIRGLAHIGALQELDKNGMLKGVKEWIGVSAGSILSLMIVVGYTLNELKNFCELFDFSNVIDLDDATSLLFKFGIDTGEKMKRLLDALLKEKGHTGDTTFRDLQEKGLPGLKIFATDLNKAEYRIFSYATTPTYKVVDAVRASSSLPYYFQPVIDAEMGNILVDGGVISNFPLLYMTEQERKETIGLNLKKRVDSAYNLEFIDFLYRPMSIRWRENCILEEALFGTNCITIETRLTNPLAFNLSQNEKEELFNEGRDAVRVFLKKFTTGRRWSVS
jgi:NTE family protein